MDSSARRLTISQLSSATGVHPSTIKFYIAEGLLPRGELIATNRALYTDSHVERLHMIRAMVTVGGVSIASVRRIVNALDGESLTTLLAAAQDAASAEEPPEFEPTPTMAHVRDLFSIASDDYLCEHPSVALMAQAIDNARPLIGSNFDTWLAELVGAARQAADADLELIDSARSRTDAAQIAAVGTALGDVILAHARRLAQSVRATDHYGPGTNR